MTARDADALRRDHAFDCQDGVVEPAEHIAAIEVAGRRFAAVLARAGMDDPIPPCPGWDVRELARHLGGIHRWATRFVSEARTAVIDADLEEIVGGWPDDPYLAAWFVDGHRRLLDALTSAPEDLECFTFLEAPSPLAMWARRQAHETAIHRVDMESAIGSVTSFPAPFASDGIDELLTAFITRPGRGPRASSEQRLAVAPVDDPARWTVRFDAATCETVRGPGDADVTVAGAASDLYMWVWNRPPIGDVAIIGRRSVAETWRDSVHVRWS